MRTEKIKQLAQQSGFDLQEDGNFYSPPQGQWINQEIYEFAQLVIQEFVPKEHTQTNLIYRLQERARLRRELAAQPDSIADLLDEAAQELLKYRPQPRPQPLHEEYHAALYSADYKQSQGIR